MLSGTGVGVTTHNTSVYSNIIRDNANGVSLEKSTYSNTINNNQIYNHTTSGLGGMGLKISGAGS